MDENHPACVHSIMRWFATAFLILAAGCKAELPTEPSASSGRPVIAQTFESGGATLAPQSISIPVGSTFVATATVKYPPAVVPWTFGSSYPAVASADGYIAVGGTSSPVNIRGITPGQTHVYYLVPNFGRAPSTWTIGVVTVSEALPPTCTPPAFASQPTDQSLVAGERVTFRVAFSGSPPFACQWFAQEVGGAPYTTSNDVAFVTEKLYRTTYFWVSVTNPCGSTTSAIATVTVVPARVVAERIRTVRH